GINAPGAMRAAESAGAAALQKRPTAAATIRRRHHGGDVRQCSNVLIVMNSLPMNGISKCRWGKYTSGVRARDRRGHYESVTARFEQAVRHVQKAFASDWRGS